MSKIIRIRNRWNKPQTRLRVVNSVKPIYAYDHELKKLVEVGTRDFNAYVNSFYEMSLLKNKLTRFKNGDITALNVTQGIYADISGMPTDFNSLSNLVHKANTEAKSSGFDSIQSYMQGIFDEIAKPKTENSVVKEDVNNE